MKTNLITPIIWVGGSKSSYWPFSGASTAKQFCQRGSKKTRYQESLLRVQNRDIFNAPIVVCSVEHQATAQVQAGEIGVSLEKIVSRPLGKNTAANIALAAAAADDAPDALYLVNSSDQKISDLELFNSDIEAAKQADLNERSILIFDIKSFPSETDIEKVKVCKSGFAEFKYFGLFSFSQCVQNLPQPELIH